MKQIAIIFIAIISMLVGFVAGADYTMKCATPVGATENNTGYVISYRYGDLWFNELYQ